MKLQFFDETAIEGYADVRRAEGRLSRRAAGATFGIGNRSDVMLSRPSLIDR
jgi:hypothetical protein